MKCVIETFPRLEDEADWGVVEMRLIGADWGVVHVNLMWRHDELGGHMKRARAVCLLGLLGVCCSSRPRGLAKWREVGVEGGCCVLTACGAD